MFERFTADARQAVVAAQDEARGLRAEEITPVHLLLALARDTGRGGGVLRAAGVDHASVEVALARSGGALDAAALDAVGIDLDRVRAAAEAAFGPGALDLPGHRTSGHIPFADGSKRALEESLRHVLRQRGRRRDHVIDSAAVLAGLLAVADPAVERVLHQLGTGADRLRAGLSDSDAA